MADQTYQADDIFKTIQSMESSSSGRGISYWTLAATCGRKANLAARHQETFKAEMMASEDGKLNPLLVGIYYHALQQFYHDGRLPEGTVYDYSAELYNDEFIEAKRLFDFYRQNFNPWFWGQVLATELKVPQTPEGAEMMKAYFSDDTTGRLDMLVHMSENDMSHIGALFNIHLPGPGLYIIDHKTGGQKRTMDYWDFTHGAQAILYPFIWNKENPTRQVKGMIFVKIVRHIKLSMTNSIQPFVHQPQEGLEEVVRALVVRGKAQLEENRTNPAVCFSGFRPCGFYLNGQCDRR